MNHSRTDERRCVFQVRCPGAQQVKLVLEYRRGVSQVFPLKPCGEDVWATTLNLAPGSYRYCYHAYNGRTLTYLTPDNAVMDGLKALLQVEEPVVPTQARHGASLRPAALSWRQDGSDEDDPLALRDASPVS